MKKLNIQAISRRDAGLMQTMVPAPGHVFVSIDLSSGEPTVTGEFSKDPNYLYATYHGVGKRPFYKDGVLMIDDIYLMVASVSPLGKEKIYDTFHNHKFDGKSFADQWLEDSEVVKSYLKEVRTLHKILCLGIGYGMQARKMVTSMYEKGYLLDLKTAKQFCKVYWQLFSGVKAFSDTLTLEIERKGYIINPFGYRLTPDPRKAYNYYCQSSVSGVMHLFGALLFSIAPWAKFVVCIHDEFVISVDEGRLEEFRKCTQAATEEMNNQLKWDVKIRTGFCPGRTLFDAK